MHPLRLTVSAPALHRMQADETFPKFPDRSLSTPDKSSWKPSFKELSGSTVSEVSYEEEHPNELSVQNLKTNYTLYKSEGRIKVIKSKDSPHDYVILSLDKFPVKIIKTIQAEESPNIVVITPANPDDDYKSGAAASRCKLIPLWEQPREVVEYIESLES